MSVSAHDVAVELRRRLPDVGSVKVHKLLYYAQGWHLRWFGEPLFNERIEAWTNGPVVAELWLAEDKRGGAPRPLGLDGIQLATVGYVVSRYGAFTGRQLIRLTHTEDPWRHASEAEEPNPPISHTALAAWFAHDEETAHVEALWERIAADPSLRARFHQPAADPATLSTTTVEELRARRGAA